MVGWIVSLLQTIPSGVVDQMATPNKKAKGTARGIDPVSGMIFPCEYNGDVMADSLNREWQGAIAKHDFLLASGSAAV
ncbi:hypothetical protein NFHSH190041_10120 [Shewanella sp. NFH-SH190041]|nr:hypothetical protein NFHSH190041_10120 [Shewanella sp. NFH-SH190041]